MPPFDLDTNPAEDRALQLLRDGAVTLFWRRRLLDDTTAWLAEHGYQLVRLDATAWATEADLHRDVKAALDVPDYYGHNLAAFTDCMRDVATYSYGARRDSTGTVLVLTGYDAFAAHERGTAGIVLDIIAGAAREALLFGHRLLCLVQSDDPEIAFDPVGATPVTWNLAEFLRADRR